jgi:arabinogalactan endo-1,4-beta-galactosidase
MAHTFALGADVSWLPMMEADAFPFKNRNGEPQDCLLTLKHDFHMKL